MSKIKVETPSDREVRVVRVFAAPAQFVWDAHTKPELVRRWQTGYDGWSMSVCEMDVRVDGAYRWRWRNNDNGQEMGFFGKFLEVKPHTKLVHEEHYDPGDVGGPMTSDPAIITTTFSETDGFTTLTVAMMFASKEARDGAVASGMTDGMEFSYQRIDAMVPA